MGGSEKAVSSSSCSESGESGRSLITVIEGSGADVDAIDSDCGKLSCAQARTISLLRAVVISASLGSSGRVPLGQSSSIQLETSLSLLNPSSAASNHMLGLLVWNMSKSIWMSICAISVSRSFCHSHLFSHFALSRNAVMNSWQPAHSSSSWSL